ncbi:MAG TPA: DUF4082 domain-containing protein [Gemmataceae bacterium]|jgi:hypothetical protein
MKRITHWGCLLAVLVFVTPPAAAQPIHLLTSSGSGPSGSFGSEGDGTGGYGFTVGSSPLVVTRLGLWDQGGNGLTESHEVGLWTAGGTLLGSVTVPAGTGGTLIGQFRYADLGPSLVLSAGQTYVLGAHYPTPADPFRLDNNTDMPSLFSGDATYEQPRSNGGFNFPNPTLGTFAYVGPNLEYVVAAVPEPSGLLLAGFGAMSLLGYHRHRKDRYHVTSG